MSDDELRKAVALAYQAPDPPQVVASGRGPVAEAIIAEALRAGVAVERNPELAEMLSRIELDATIPEDLYRAVAVVIAGVLRAAHKAAAGSAGLSGARRSEG